MTLLVRGLAPLSVDLTITQVIQNATLSPAAGNPHIPIYDELHGTHQSAWLRAL